MCTRRRFRSAPVVLAVLQTLSCSADEAAPVTPAADVNAPARDNLPSAPAAVPERMPALDEPTPATVDEAPGIGAVLPESESAAPGTSAPPAARTLARISVNAGMFRRDHSVVRFALPSSLSAEGSRSFQLSDTAGNGIPVQVGSDGSACFVLDALDAGQQAEFLLEERAAVAGAAISAVEEQGVVRVRVGASTLLDFQMRGALPAGLDPVFLRGGYVYPLYTPTGALVSDDYPSDHYHHHGIWSAWTSTDVNGHDVDFWNMGSGSGKVDFTRLDALWQGDVHAGFEAILAHTDRVSAEPATVLEERWSVTAYRTHPTSPPYFLFDLDSTQTLVGSSPLNLHTYTYGGFALRGPAEGRDPSNLVFASSEGGDRVAGENQPARWVFLGGNVAGRAVGTAMLGHPSNFRAPQRVRVNPVDPYLNFSPVKDGAFSIQPGVPYTSHFRFVTLDGVPDPVLLDRLWNDYASPPEVSVREISVD